MEKSESNKIELETVLKKFIGVWAIEIDKNKPPRMYIDDNYKEYLCFPKKIKTPEELYEYWYKGIDKKHLKVVDDSIIKMKKNIQTEAQVPWKHPKKGNIYVRFGGSLNENFTKGIRIEGICQDVTDLVHIQKTENQNTIELLESKADILSYSGIAQALCRDYESVYYVNIDNYIYKEYSSQGKFKGLKIQSQGSDFFEDSIKNLEDVVYIGDRRRLAEFLKKDKILEELKQRKSLSIQYRLLVEGKPEFYQLNVVPSLEDDKSHYIFAIRNINEQVIRENAYNEKIKAATEMANKDALTGVKNRLAYENAEEVMNEEIKKGSISPFAVAVFDINNLKIINDTDGHEAGDELICNASKLICNCFSHSPVYRIGGDEFAVILIGADYFDKEVLMNDLRQKVKENQSSGKVVIASGMSDFDFNNDLYVADIFERADEKMYKNKQELKEKPKKSTKK